MEMSRIKSLPKEPLEDWKKEIMEDVYIQEAIEIYSEQAFKEYNSYQLIKRFLLYYKN